MTEFDDFEDACDDLSDWLTLHQGHPGGTPNNEELCAAANVMGDAGKTQANTVQAAKEAFFTALAAAVDDFEARITVLEGE